MENLRNHTTGTIERVLQVNTADVGGGAEKVAFELHRAYGRRGVRSTLAVGRKFSDTPGVVAIDQSRFRSRWAQTIGSSSRATVAGTLTRALAEPIRYAARLAGREDFGFPASAYVDTFSPTRPSIVHVHNMHGGYFDIRALPHLSSRLPVVLSPHDPWPFTGHCAHPMDCPRWSVGCGHCPDLNRYVPIIRDASRLNRRIKHEALRRSRINLVSPSRWLLGFLEYGDLAQGIVRSKVIPNGVDRTVFQPRDRFAARHELGLPNDRMVVVTSARFGTANDFKGHDVLDAALESLAGMNLRDPLVLVLGDDVPERRAGCATVRSVPYTSDSARIAQTLAAADLYVHPSRAENYSLAVLEALSCGTPTVASDAGGTAEILAGRLGARLFPNGDHRALAAHLATLSDPDTSALESMREAALHEAAGCMTITDQADAYLDWYAEILEEEYKAK